MTDAEYRIDPEEAVAAAIDAAEEIDDSVAEKPRLLVDKSNPHQTVATLRDILAEAGGLYDRGVPVRLTVDRTQKGTVAQIMTRSGVVLRAHQVCRPYAVKKGDEVVGLPPWFALMYLEWWGEWHLPALNGIASAPLLQDDGTINSTEGYDPASGMWCENVPDLTGRVPEQPTRDEAEAALQLVRAPCERNHGTSGACQAAWQITDDVVELICLRDHDW
jgi:hypothetical protein